MSGLLSRDSVLWVVLFRVGAVLSVAASIPTVVPVEYATVLREIGLGLVAVAGKLGNSPLPGAVKG